MIRTTTTLLIAFSIAACATQPGTDAGTQTIPRPAGCKATNDKEKQLVVRYGSGSNKHSPVGVDKENPADPTIEDPAKLKVAECDVVRIKFKTSGNLSAMVAFDKPGKVKSPGLALGYFNHGNYIYVPIDDRAGSGPEQFEYSIYVECPANTACSPLDPIIVVER